MSIKKNLFKSSVAIRVVTGFMISALLTTSVFAATGLLTTKSSAEDIKNYIQQSVDKQVEERLKEMLGTSDIETKVTNKLDEEAVVAKLKEQIKTKLTEALGAKISKDKIDAAIGTSVETTIDAIIDSVIDSTVSEAIENIDLSKINEVDLTVDVQDKVREECEKQIKEIIDGNLTTVIDEVVAELTGNTSTETTEPSTPSDPVVESNFVTKTLSSDGRTLTIDPTSSWNGKTLDEFLTANSEELNLVASTTDYGMWLTNIGGILPAGYNAVKTGNQLIEYDYYVSYYINDEYAEVGVSSEVIDENDVYKFTVDSYATSTVLAEVEVYDALPTWAPITVWGATQSAEFPSFVLHVYKDIDGVDLESGQKVEDVLNRLELVIEVSGTGYSKFTYGDKVISQSNIVNNRRAFVPTVYSMTAKGDSYNLGYAKGVHPAKTSVEIVSNGETKNYFLANEWDGKTARADAVFE